ncbi:hypothetical protein BZA05DRAFT_402366 [Tricharina praecox]|uniref:uncharacterized protein n=1 Tax=Tricharina praecox TaxID=43433 RepID=UPI00221E397E|nr:uncharacterized protein BZA05DRAFT_402366 [Tricharina praecox]KAI5849144.1 hypothetical protein BZA05DRAFT_402366 [Tricharina praecox]
MSNPRSNAKSKTKSDDEAYRGGTLAELSARGGTHIPADSGTQNVVHSSAREKHFKTDPKLVHPSADNMTDLPDNPQVSGLTGEVVTLMGDQLPPGVEGKHVGPTHGGKQMRPGKHTLKASQGKDIGATGPGHYDTQ